VWSRGAPQWVTDFAHERFPRSPSAASNCLAGAFAFPLRDRDQILGVIEFFSEEVRPPDERVLSLVETFGRQIGQYMRRKQAEEAAHESERRRAAMLDSALDAVIAIDHRGHIVDFNPAAERTFGYRSEEVLGREMAELIVPPALRARHRSALARTVATGEGRLLDRRLELTGMRRGGEEFPFELTITRIAGEGPPAFTGYVRDITARRRYEERSALLAEAGETLTASLDLETTLRSLADLCVPQLADWCAIDLLRPDERRLERMAVAHLDPDKQALGYELQARYPTDLRAPEGLPKAIRIGRSELFEVVSDDLLEAVAQDAEHLRILRQLGIGSGMVVPLRARGRTFGAMVLAAESGRRFAAPDLAFAEELARRAALAIDNARIHAERSRIAETLQSSLLPPRLPHVPGLAVASRFRAAGEAYEVGGDFFDLFATGPADWTIVMGDVSGKGPEAAAVTALARYTIREAAAHEEYPSGVLRRLNEAVLSYQAEGGEHFCTALVGRIEPLGDRARLWIASGGHPLPMRLGREGQVEEVGSPGMLMGITRSPDLVDAELELRPGESLLLYTDGVTDTPTAGGILGEQGLAALLTSCRDLDAEALVERIDRTVVELQAGTPRDDIAMVAIQVRGPSPSQDAITGDDEEQSPFALATAGRGAS
jgi:PAS domain S-box-containing protein